MIATPKLTDISLEAPEDSLSIMQFIQQLGYPSATMLLQVPIILSCDKASRAKMQYAADVVSFVTTYD